MDTVESRLPVASDLPLSVRPQTDLRIQPSVAELLALAPLVDAEPDVVAGRELLNRPVRWVHIDDLPMDPADMLQSGELLLTHGVGLDADEQLQRRLRPTLAVRAAEMSGKTSTRSFAGLPMERHSDCTSSGRLAVLRNNELILFYFLF